MYSIRIGTLGSEKGGGVGKVERVGDSLIKDTVVLVVLFRASKSGFGTSYNNDIY